MSGLYHMNISFMDPWTIQFNTYIACLIFILLTYNALYLFACLMSACVTKCLLVSVGV